MSGTLVLCASAKAALAASPGPYILDAKGGKRSLASFAMNLMPIRKQPFVATLCTGCV